MGKMRTPKKKIKYNRMYYFNTSQKYLDLLCGEYIKYGVLEEIGKQLVDNQVAGIALSNGLQELIKKKSENKGLFRNITNGIDMNKELYALYHRSNSPYCALGFYDTENMKSSFTKNELNKLTLRLTSYVKYVVIKSKQTNIDTYKYIEACQAISAHNDFVTTLVKDWLSCRWVPSELKQPIGYVPDLDDVKNYEGGMVAPLSNPLTPEEIIKISATYGNDAQAAKAQFDPMIETQMCMMAYNDGYGISALDKNWAYKGADTCSLSKTTVRVDQVKARINDSLTRLIKFIKNILGGDLVSYGNEIKFSLLNNSTYGYLILPIKDGLEDVSLEAKLLFGTLKLSYKPKESIFRKRKAIKFKKSYKSTKRTYKSNKYKSYPKLKRYAYKSRYADKKSYVSKYPRKSYKSSKYSKIYNK